jgi:hypothetical protein
VASHIRGRGIVRIFTRNGVRFPSAKRLGGGIRNRWRGVFQSYQKLKDWESVLGTLWRCSRYSFKLERNDTFFLDFSISKPITTTDGKRLSSTNILNLIQFLMYLINNLILLFGLIS